MLSKVAHTFTSAQEQRFTAKHGHVLSPGERALLSGPVVHVAVAHRGIPFAGPGTRSDFAIAMIDTGCDRTSVRMDSLMEWWRRARLFPPLRLATGGGVFLSDVSFQIQDTTATHPLRPLPASRRTGSEVIVLDNMAGYEDILIGRDMLEAIVFCVNAAEFSLIAKPSCLADDPHLR